MYVGLLAAFGLVPNGELLMTAAQLWIGDMIGITVLTPFLLIVSTRRRILVPSFELAAAHRRPRADARSGVRSFDTFRVKQFYLFFLPVMWMAVRFGLEGVTPGLVIAQIGLMTAMHYAGVNASEITAYQALMIVLSLTGLTIGAVVSEQQKTQAQLRQNQEALERAARLDTMGAFAAALAHEINQPLTAISNYTRLAKMAVESNRRTMRPHARRPRTPWPRSIARPRSSRRLRDFIQLGHNEMRSHSVTDLIRNPSLIASWMRSRRI